MAGLHQTLDATLEKKSRWSSEDRTTDLAHRNKRSDYSAAAGKRYMLL